METQKQKWGNPSQVVGPLKFVFVCVITNSLTPLLPYSLTPGLYIYYWALRMNYFNYVEVRNYEISASDLHLRERIYFMKHPVPGGAHLPAVPLDLPPAHLLLHLSNTVTVASRSPRNKDA